MLKFVSHSVRAFSKEIDLKNASLKQILRSQIKEKGPLTFPSYWHQALLHEKFGYYMKQDVFNKEGDFVTSVEISQLFNEVSTSPSLDSCYLAGSHLPTYWGA